MDVILRKDVEKVGLRGDVVSVARGYARNFLFPRQLAEEATPARVAELQKREANRARHEAKTAGEAQSIADTLTKTVLRFEVKAGPTGSLFGSVTPTDIADEIWRTRKVRVDRRKIGIDNIKRIGRYDVPIDLFEGVRVDVKTLVAPEGGELPSDEELEAMEAAEAAERAAAEPEAQAKVEYEDVPEDDAPRQSPAEAAMSADEPSAPAAADEPDWRADADAALRDA
ncbi:MAG TPA: 50S ribosomal protein L9 [Gaiellaceae bacterium]|jgi:large subunit ribosomal protein L9|nr:50S ribosomal protein L9 [Gaiellaceae bacterium]